MNLKGNVKQAVCRWCYPDLSLEELCEAAKNIGIAGVDLVGPSDWPVLQKYGLESSMCNGAELNLTDGFNDMQFHSRLLRNYSEMIPRVAQAGYKNLICFSGNRRGMDDEIGLNNCASALRTLMPLAEQNQVTLCMELLNSRRDHPDYQCDRTEWGIELVRKIGSPNFKLLYDIYHMQIMEGDIICNIEKYHEYIAHYHTGGVPGRNEINAAQEINYATVIKTIQITGFTGFVAHEFMPSHYDKITSLHEAVAICDV